MIAKTMRNAFRKNDFIGRWGGEEFLAVIVGVSAEDLSHICEKIRILVKNSVLRLEGVPVGVTISIGSTLVCQGDTLASIQQRADNALYISKQTGRDKVTIV
jgi:diguanylate cyclase (GGDEF)-like protein